MKPSGHHGISADAPDLRKRKPLIGDHRIPTRSYVDGGLNTCPGHKQVVRPPDSIG